MKRKKFYIILAILIVISLFSFAALCNQCAADTGDKEDVGEDETSAVSDDDGNSDGEENGDGDGNGGGNGDKEAPTITLEVYEGPTLEGSICYYRVRATVTGSPDPVVSFSKDDSGGAWLPKRVQINLNNPADTYTLTATATNSEGSDTDSIELSWGCEEPEPEPEPEPEAVINLDVPKVITEGGYIEEGGKINTGGGLFAGDSAVGSGYIGDKPVRGYVSFDISGLNGKIIDQAILTFNLNSIYGVPDPAFGGIWVGVVDWGAEALVLADFGLPQVGIQLFNMSGDGNITCDTTTLKTQLQNAINAGKSRFQIRISHPGIGSNHNNTWDGWSYIQAGINLNINYH